MPFGLVLLPDRRTHDRLAALAAAIGGRAPINVLGPHAPAHVSVVHFDGDETQAEQIREQAFNFPVQVTTVKVIGLLYAVVPAGDYYVPQGGVYFGIEVIRRPELNDLHAAALECVRVAGARPLGAVGDDFQPHITLGMTGSPVLPDLADVPVGEISLTLAFGELGPYGTFPGLSSS
jgi:2'-5' RNA ligase